MNIIVLSKKGEPNFLTNHSVMGYRQCSGKSFMTSKKMPLPINTSWLFSTFIRDSSKHLENSKVEDMSKH